MPKIVSDSFKDYLYTLNSDKSLIVLIEITHPNLTPPLRLAAYDTDVVSNGDIYTAAPIDITFPADQEGRVQSTSIRFTNVTRELTPIIRGLTTIPTLSVKLVLSDDPDIVEIQYGNFKLRATEINQLEVTGTFAQDSLDDIQFGWRFTTTIAPNIHQIQR